MAVWLFVDVVAHEADVVAVDARARQDAGVGAVEVEPRDRHEVRAVGYDEPALHLRALARPAGDRHRRAGATTAVDAHVAVVSAAAQAAGLPRLERVGQAVDGAVRAARRAGCAVGAGGGGDLGAAHRRLPAEQHVAWALGKQGVVARGAVGVERVVHEVRIQDESGAQVCDPAVAVVAHAAPEAVLPHVVVGALGAGPARLDVVADHRVRDEVALHHVVVGGGAVASRDHYALAIAVDHVRRHAAAVGVWEQLHPAIGVAMDPVGGDAGARGVRDADPVVAVGRGQPAAVVDLVLAHDHSRHLARGAADQHAVAGVPVGDLVVLDHHVAGRDHRAGGAGSTAAGQLQARDLDSRDGDRQPAGDLGPLAGEALQAHRRSRRAAARDVDVAAVDAPAQAAGLARQQRAGQPRDRAKRLLHGSEGTVEAGRRGDAVAGRIRSRGAPRERRGQEGDRDRERGCESNCQCGCLDCACTTHATA